MKAPHLRRFSPFRRSSRFSPSLALVPALISSWASAGLAQDDLSQTEPSADSGDAPADESSAGSVEGATVDTSLETNESGGEDGVVVEEGSGLFASASSDESGVSTDDGALALEWGGYVRGDFYVGKAEHSTELNMNAGYGEVAFQPRVRTGNWGGAFVDLRFRYGQQLDEYKLFTDFREGYASAYLGPVELRMGKQIVVWGRADGFNPTSNIAPMDFRIRSPIEDDRRVGRVGARAFVTWKVLKLEGVWMPFYEPTMYPEFQINDSVTSFVDPIYPNARTTIRNGTEGARLNLELPAFEGSISYLYGAAPLPGIDLESFLVGSPNATGTPLGYIHIRRHAYRQHVIGADFATTVSDWFGLRGEAAYRMPIDYKNNVYVARPDAQWVLGIDREFGPVSIIAQYLGKYTFDWEPARPVDDRGADGILSLNPANPADVQTANDSINATIFNTNRALFNQLYQFQTLASLRIEWKTLHDTLSISALGLYNFNTREWFVSPKVGYQIIGGLNAYVGAEIYNGPPGTLFDLIDQKLTSGYAELRASF